ncbi:hypothetical protein [Alkalimarinus coralli]|uniref:hypothetical protein n=1 Tax=Alkalimarinus coralli TaxID=2935863 RepID=UPI00202B3915|nr:hypothetical protein [Alkalimarinus coralli]
MIFLPIDHRPDYKNRTTTATSKDVRHVDHSETTQQIRRERASERRRMPDRRKKQAPLAGKERRRVNDRRSPLLLNAHSAKPEALHSRKGATINTKA